MNSVPSSRSSRGCPPAWLAVLLVGPLALNLSHSGVARAQPGRGGRPGGGATAPAPAPAPAPKAAPTPKADPIDKEALQQKQEEEGVVDTENVKRTERVETFNDPRAAPLLAVDKFNEVTGGPRVSPNIDREILAMATGEARLDTTSLRNYVFAQVVQLTDHDNLNALVNPPPDLNPNSSAAKGFNQAAESLMDKLQRAQDAKNAGFLSAYRRDLLEFMPKLLDYHLFTRIEAMILLGVAGDPEAMPVFIKQIQEPEQVLMVKLWAARGLTNIAQGGRREVEVGRGALAATTISTLLEQQPDLPWPVRMRLLEALGALRMAGQNRAENATAALQVLADPDARPMLRAWASWSLGLMKVPPQVSQFNYGLVAYFMGRAAVDLGGRVESAFSESPDLSRRLTGLLVYQVLPGLRGDPDVRDSGVANALGLGREAKLVGEIAAQVQSIAIAALNLTGRATPRPEHPQRRKELASRVAALRDYLAANRPEDAHLVPGGREFPLPAPPESPKVATGGAD